MTYTYPKLAERIDELLDGEVGYDLYMCISEDCESYQKRTDVVCEDCHKQAFCIRKIKPISLAMVLRAVKGVDQEFKHQDNWELAEFVGFDIGLYPEGAFFYFRGDGGITWNLTKNLENQQDELKKWLYTLIKNK